MVRLAALPALLAVVCASPASAHGGADVPPLQDSLRYEVRGNVPVICGLGGLSGSEGQVRIENVMDPADGTARSATARLPFSLSCNAPMTVTLTSDNGGLATVAGTPDTDFTSRIAYTAAVNLPGAAAVLSCTSANMNANAGGCSATVNAPVTSGDGSVDVTLNPDGRLLLRGEYSDRVTLTIMPVLG